MKNKKSLALRILLLALACITLLLVGVGCESEEELEAKYTPTNIKYDGSRLTWNKVNGAQYYTVSINGGEEKRANTALFTYNAQGNAFEATISTYAEDESYSTTVSFTPLDTISEFFVANDGTVSWSEVAGATGYIVQVNGRTLDSEITDTAFTPEAGQNRIKVRPVVIGDDSYFSAWSPEKTVTINQAPQNINYNNEYISWLGNAQSYELSINGTPQTVTGNKIEYNSGNLDFTVSIKALGNYTTTYDSKVVNETFYYLKTATDFVVEDGILTWAPVANADGYKVKVAGVVQNETLTEPKFDKIPAGYNVEIAIMPYKTEGKFFSNWSETKSICLLKAPELKWNNDLELDGEAKNNISWNIAGNEAGFVVEVKKDDFVLENTPLSGDSMAFSYAFSEVGTYTVRVKATAEKGSDFYDSAYSAPIQVTRLAGPKAAGSNYIVSDPTNLKAGFTVSYEPVFGASGYQLYKDGTLLDGKFSTTGTISDYNVADDSVIAGQEHTYVVKAMGGIKYESGITKVTLPSLTTSSLSFNIKVLPMPINLTISGFVASWDSVQGSNGYSVKYDGATFTAAANSHDLSGLTPGMHNVSVCAKGNGGATLASNYTAEMIIERLSAPTNIKITYSNGEGVLSFDEHENAKGYQIYLNNSKDPLPENSDKNMYQYISEQGTPLSLVSVANYFNELGTVYYMSSQNSPTKQFIRLAAPTIPEGAFASNGEFVWSAPSNINTAEYTPTYVVHFDNVAQTGGEQNTTRYNIEQLEGGRYYTFKVRAVGDNSNYLDSEFSSEVTIYKLATPKLVIKNNQYTWDSVTNASSYVVEIDGKRVDNGYHVSGSECSFTPYYETPGNHTVKIYAIGDGGHNTINSAPYEFTQTVQILLSPVISYSYSNDRVVNGGFITVNVDTESENNNGYIYEIAGETKQEHSSSCTKVIDKEGVYTVRVKAAGGKIDENGIYYLDSAFAGGGTGYTIALLAPPTRATFEMNSDGVIKWGISSGALGYDYQLSFDNGAFTDIAHSGYNSLDAIKDFKTYKTITIRVCASGNGSSIIASEWIEWTWDNPLL